MNIDEVEEGEVKSDEEKTSNNNRVLGIDNSDRLEDEEAPKTTSKTARRLKNNKNRRGNKRHKYNKREDDEENNPFEELDPQMIKLKIKALKSLLGKNSSSSKKRRVKSPRNVSDRGENDTNDRDFYLELGRRNLEKVNMCIYDERLMRGGCNVVLFAGILLFWQDINYVFFR